MFHKSLSHKHRISFFLLFMMLFSFSAGLFSTETAMAAADIDHVQDLADILTDEEEENLRNECISVGDLNEIDIFILTTDSVPENRKLYIENFYDTHDDILTDAVLLLVNMDPEKRGVEIQGYGQCEFSISDDRIELILDEIISDLSDGDYFDAFFSYIYEVDYYMSIEATSDYVHTEADNEYYNENYNEEPLTHADYIIFNLFASVVVGAISVLIIVLVNALGRGSVTTNRNTYMDTSNSRILGHWDRYIRTTTTRRRKPKDNGGGHSGHIGGGVSSGGHSHSGGGRSF